MIWNKESTLALIEAYSKLKEIKGPGSLKTNDWAQLSRAASSPSAEFTLKQTKTHWQQLQRLCRAYEKLSTKPGARWDPNSRCFILPDVTWNEIYEKEPQLVRYKNRPFQFYEQMANAVRVTKRNFGQVPQENADKLLRPANDNVFFSSEGESDRERDHERDQQRYQVRDQERDHERNQVREQVRDQERDRERDQVRDHVRDNNNESFHTPNPYVDQSEDAPDYVPILTVINSIADKFLAANPNKSLTSKVIQRAIQLDLDAYLRKLTVVLSERSRMADAMMVLSDEVFIELVTLDVPKLYERTIS